MAQQQQTVLRVQTNKINPDVTVPTGLIEVVTGSTNTTGWTYTGDGTVQTPFSGTTSVGTNYFTVQVKNTGGLLNYEFSGFNQNYVYRNGIEISTPLTDSEDQIQVYTNDIIYFETYGTGSTMVGISFEPTTVNVYQYEDLDLYTSVPIKINKSFAELQDVSKRNSDYSIGLSLPGSKKNNAFFESFYNVDNVTLYFDPTKRVPIDVLIDDQKYFTGYLKLNSVKVQNSAVEYDVTLYSSVGDLFGKIGNKLLKDLDYEDPDYGCNHEFNVYSVTYWNYDIFDYEPPLWFYPIVHNGYNYSGSSETPLISGSTSGQTRLYTSTIVSGYSSNAAAYAAGVKKFRINSPEGGLIDNQLKPALNIKNIIKLMFKTYGYEIESEFFNTPWFKLLYMYGYFSSDETKFSYTTQPTETFPLNDVNVIVDGTVFGIVNIYPVKEGTGIPAFCNSPISVELEFEDYSIPDLYTTGYTIPAYSTGITITYGVPDEYVRPIQSGTSVTILNASLAYLPGPPNQSVQYNDGMYVNFNEVIHPDIKQIDILASIAKKFNLVFIPDPLVPNKIIIEPYQYYIGTGTIRDWTDKLSWDKGFTVQPALNFIESEIILKDLEDGDVGNKIFKDRNNRVYGQNNVYNVTDFKSQTKTIETTFSPQLIRKWDTDATAPNGNISLPLGINYSMTDNEASQGDNTKTVFRYKGLRTKPKLFYYLGNYNPFLDTYGEVFTYSGYTTTNRIYSCDSNGTLSSQDEIIPVISHTMPIGNPDSNKINNDSICNLFNSELPTDVGVSTYNVYTEKDCYDLFYKDRINNLFSKDTRFLSGYFDLKLSDLENLREKDIIKINEQYFLLNKIDGYNLTNPELTKVELIQINNTVSTYPKRYFMYYYCDNTGQKFKFETDMTNPILKETNYGWSVLYDYNIGILGGNATGYTACAKDYQEPDVVYIPYTIYEVDENTYNTTGTGRTYDTLWQEFGGYDDVTSDFHYPNRIFGTTVEILNLFTGCTDFNTYASTYGIITGSSTYYTTSGTTYTSGATINVTDTGWIKYKDSTDTTQYEYVGTTGTYTITACLNCTTIAPGVPYADLATFTLDDCGNSC